MPVYLCRWPNGDCAFVSARNKSDACFTLDLEIAEAEESQLVELKDNLLLGLKLKDNGELELEHIGDHTQEALNGVYPLLAEALGQTEITEEEAASIVRDAVGAERNRLRSRASASGSD